MRKRTGSAGGAQAAGEGGGDEQASEGVLVDELATERLKSVARHHGRTVPVLLLLFGAASIALAVILAGAVDADRIATLGRHAELKDVAFAGVALVAAASMCGWRRASRKSRPDLRAEVLHVELTALREENAKLRLQDQRALSVGRAAQRIRETAAAAIAEDDDGSDDAWNALAQATVMRTALSAICQDLQTAVGQMQRRLGTMIPAPELDRRVAEVPDFARDASRDRRAARNGHNGDGDGRDGELSLAATIAFSPEAFPGGTS